MPLRPLFVLREGKIPGDFFSRSGTDKKPFTLYLAYRMLYPGLHTGPTQRKNHELYFFHFLSFFPPSIENVEVC